MQLVDGDLGRCAGRLAGSLPLGGKEMPWASVGVAGTARRQPLEAPRPRMTKNPEHTHCGCQSRRTSDKAEAAGLKFAFQGSETAMKGWSQPVPVTLREDAEAICA